MHLISIDSILLLSYNLAATFYEYYRNTLSPTQQYKILVSFCFQLKSSVAIQVRESECVKLAVLTQSYVSSIRGRKEKLFEKVYTTTYLRFLRTRMLKFFIKFWKPFLFRKQFMQFYHFKVLYTCKRGWRQVFVVLYCLHIFFKIKHNILFCFLHSLQMFSGQM